VGKDSNTGFGGRSSWSSQRTATYTTTTVPNPYYPYVTTAYIALFAVIMIAVTLQLYDSLMGEIE